MVTGFIIEITVVKRQLTIENRVFYYYYGSHNYPLFLFCLSKYVSYRRNRPKKNGSKL